MSYSAGEALLVALLKTATGFNSTTKVNVLASDWTCLSSGKSDHYAITHLGQMGKPEQLTPGILSMPWITTVEIWQQYEDDATTQTNIYGHLNTLVALIAPKPHFGGSDSVVLNSFIESIGPLEEMWKKGGGPEWLRISINVAWLEQMPVTISE